MTITNIKGELGRYFVQSEHDQNIQYLVDLFENPIRNRCAGQCDCTDWRVRRKVRLEVADEVNNGVLCKHTRACFERFGQEMAFLIQKGQLKKS